jgi:hypothetical protein
LRNGIRDNVSDVFGGRGTRQAGHDDRRFSRKLDDIGRDCNVFLCKLGASRWSDVEADDMPSAIDQIARDRASHDPKPDDSNGLIHSSPFPAR